jgi:hypothetical protein
MLFNAVRSLLLQSDASHVHSRKHRPRLSTKTEKSLFTPNLRGLNTSPPNYENGFFTPELSKTAQVTPEVVLKNHNKSQKIIK